MFSWEVYSRTCGCAHLFLSVPRSLNPIGIFTFKPLNKSQFFLTLTYVETLFSGIAKSSWKEPFRLSLQLPSWVTDTSVETGSSMSLAHPSLLTLALNLKYESLPYMIKPSPSFFLIFISEFFPWSYQESGNTLQGGSITFRILNSTDLKLVIPQEVRRQGGTVHQKVSILVWVGTLWWPSKSIRGSWPW